MKNVFKLIIFSFICGPLFSCATTPFDDIETVTYYDPDHDFTQYRTYAWAGTAQVLFDPIGQWEKPTLDTDEELRFAINEQLHARNMVQVNHKPDLLVTFAAGVDMTHLELKQDPAGELETPVNIPKAALIIALIDGHTGYLVWMGQAEGNARQQNSIEYIRQRIDYAVTELFSDFGP